MDEKLRDALEKIERVTRLADTLASDVPITSSARQHITNAYAALAEMRALEATPRNVEGEAERVAEIIGPHLRLYGGTNPDVDDQAQARDHAIGIAQRIVAALTRPAQTSDLEQRRSGLAAVLGRIEALLAKMGAEHVRYGKPFPFEARLAAIPVADVYVIVAALRDMVSEASSEPGASQEAPTCEKCGGEGILFGIDTMPAVPCSCVQEDAR